MSIESILPLITGLGGILGAIFFWHVRSWWGRKQWSNKDNASNVEADLPRPKEKIKVAATLPTQGTDPVPTPEPPQELTRAVANGQAVLVLGSGASAHAGLLTGIDFLLSVMSRLESALPKGLLQVMTANDPREELADLMTNLGGFAKMMDALSAGVSRERLVNSIEESVRTSSDQTSSLHNALAQPRWHAVVNLTWDDLAYKTFVEHTSTPMRSVTARDSSEISKSSRAGERLLFEPFGDFGRKASVTLTIEEMRRQFRQGPGFQRALAGLLQTHSWLFIGVGIDTIEQFLQTIASDFETIDQRHFALVPENPTNAVRESTLGRFGVSLLPYDATHGHGAVSDFAKLLRSAVRANEAKGTGGALQTLLSPDRIGRVRLVNIGPFEDLNLTLAPPESADTPAWSVIFGGNGVGKSTILRAIALAFAGNDTAALKAGARLLREGASEGRIEVQLGTQVLRTSLVRDRTTVLISSLQETPLGLGTALVLGFPALRGARSPSPAGPKPRVEPRDPDPADLLALIAGDVDGRLADFKQWLVNVLVNAHDKHPRAIEMRDLLDSLISELVPGHIEGLAPIDDSFVIRVRTPEGLVPFDELSQGMASVFNWVGLLAQRLFSVCELSPMPSNEPAIVLLDEIDAHLHPDWQRRLVELTKRHFPGLQLIATSHSALLAGALRGNETRVLERDPQDKKVSLFRYPIDLYGRRAQDILTSPVFGLESDRNPELERKIRDYFKIFEDPRARIEKQEDLVEMATELRSYGYMLDPVGAGAAMPLPVIGNAEAADRVAKHLAVLTEIADPTPSSQGEPR
ncbi:AAA family ATPase [Sinorhizobium meliloti]|uniref:AAA family ATPase n=1 Tax=Rhizobium meliloti TaxID=382 RepID=UPI001297E6AE|nr:AAA family ATPase [Sinorhizobium meliloti]MDX0191706.1 AAA family ATPase [Sinorhizobium meliloti]MQV09068.1 AAA family ATPase [Sinorhizobium meliloti]